MYTSQGDPQKVSCRRGLRILHNRSGGNLVNHSLGRHAKGASHGQVPLVKRLPLATMHTQFEETTSIVPVKRAGFFVSLACSSELTCRSRGGNIPRIALLAQSPTPDASLRPSPGCACSTALARSVRCLWSPKRHFLTTILTQSLCLRRGVYESC